MATSLPTNVDASYADDSDDPSVATHQQHHDEIHAYTNGHDTAADPHGDRAYADQQIDNATLGRTARAAQATSQSIPASMDTLVQWDAEDFDTDGFHDNATNNTRLTAPSAGKYMVGGAVRLASVADGVRVLSYLRKNGTAQRPYAEIQNGGAGLVEILVATVVDLAAGDYMELTVYHNDSVDRSTNTSGSGMWIAKIGN